jgi:hypothetical protein
MEAPDTRTACREVIDAWPNFAQLAECAERCHGYGNSDGGFGVIYPDDVDEYMAEVEEVHIPEGMVLLYGFAHAFPPGYEVLVQEKIYLENLRSVLQEQSLAAEENRVAHVLNTLVNTSN